MTEQQVPVAQHPAILRMLAGELPLNLPFGGYDGHLVAEGIGAEERMRGKGRCQTSQQRNLTKQESVCSWERGGARSLCPSPGRRNARKFFQS